MTNLEREAVQKAMLEIKESLDVAMIASGGSPLEVSVLSKMPSLSLLSLLSTNSIRFVYERPKK